jgi:hypothetical protein
LERGIAVRRGRRFLRLELPRLLGAPSEILSPRMTRIIAGHDALREAGPDQKHAF